MYFHFHYSLGSSKDEIKQTIPRTVPDVLTSVIFLPYLLFSTLNESLSKTGLLVN